MKRVRGWLVKTLVVMGAGACGITERTVQEVESAEVTAERATTRTRDEAWLPRALWE